MAQCVSIQPFEIIDSSKAPICPSEKQAVTESLISTQESAQVILYRAIQQNDTEKALQIISNNEDEISTQFVDPRCGSRWSMLHWASYYGNEKIVDALLYCNAASTYKLYQMKSALGKMNRPHAQRLDAGDNEHHYQRHQHRILDGMVANMERHPSSTKWPTDPVVINTPLHRAAQRGHLQVSWLLLLSSYSVHDVDNLGNTPLHLCSAAGHTTLLQCFLKDGADAYAKNRFHNTPYDVAKTSECRRILKEAMERQNHPLTETEKHTMHQRHLESYAQCEMAILSAIENKDSVPPHSLVKIRFDVQRAIEMGVATETVALGQEFIRWLESKDELQHSIRLVKEEAPIVSQDKYGLVKNLREVIRKCQSMSMLQKPEVTSRRTQTLIGANSFLSASGGPLVDLEPLILEGCQLCKASHEEYWLNVELQRVIGRGVSVTTKVSSHQVDATRLQNHIQQAVAANACPELIEKAKDLYEQRIGEIELILNCFSGDAWPVVRFPSPGLQSVEEMKNPKEGGPATASNNPQAPSIAADYWRNEDVGYIQQNEGFPFPPSETESYVWIPSSTLLQLRSALQTAQKYLHNAESHNANSELLGHCKRVFQEKVEQERLISIRDEEDRARAFAEAEKAAQKLKKTTSRRGTTKA